MSTKFFMLFGGENNLIARVVDILDLMEFASSANPSFRVGLRETHEECVREARAILDKNYPIFALFDYTPQGMGKFIEAAMESNEAAGLAALELGAEYVQEAQHAINAAFGITQSAAIARVQFPIAGDAAGFSSYIVEITNIRNLSIKGLAEFIRNGDIHPE